MKSNKKWLLLLALTFMLSIFLIACGGEEVNQNANNDNGTEENNDVNENNNVNDENNANNENDEAAGEPQQGGTVNIGMIGEPTTFGSVYSADNASSSIIEQMAEPLMRIDPDIEPQPLLAEDYDISDDGLTYTFEIKEGVHFHDGEELTAEDVKFTYDIFIHEDYTGPRAGDFAYLEEVVVVDDYTVEFHISEVDDRFITRFGYEIMPKHLLEDVPVADLEEHEFMRSEPVGTGPFQFVEWADGEYVHLEANEDYHGEGPYLDDIFFTIVPDQNALMAQMEAGDIDVMVIPADQIDTAEQWEADGLVNLESTLGHQYNFLGYNLRHDMFSDKETRQALTHAIDREAIVEAVAMGQGEVAHTATSPTSWSYTDDVPKFEHDPERARELLEEAGWEEGADGILERDGEPFSFELKTNQGNSVREDIAVIVQNQLAEVGIDVEVYYQEWASFIDSIEPPNYDFDAIILGWGLGTDPDPRGIWHSDEIEAGLNYIGYENEELDVLLDDNVHIIDREERTEMLHEIYEQISEDQPYTFLYYPNHIMATNPNLEGFTIHPRLDYYKLNEWWLSE